MTPGPQLRDLLSLETLSPDTFRSTSLVFGGGYHLCGGQVAAQALVAAASTVNRDRMPISIHGAYLRAGDPAEAVDYMVLRDRDGRRRSSRRIEATQLGELIFTASISLQTADADAPTRQMAPPINVPPPEECDPYEIPRLRSFEGRWLQQPFDYPEGWIRPRWPTRFWAHCTDSALCADPLLYLAVLTCLSDVSSATAVFGAGGWWTGPSIDHAVWMHATGESDGWFLVDLQPVQARAGRGVYFGSISDRRGRIVASLAQETLHRSFPVQSGDGH